MLLSRIASFIAIARPRRVEQQPTVLLSRLNAEQGRQYLMCPPCITLKKLLLPCLVPTYASRACTPTPPSFPPLSEPYTQAKLSFSYFQVSSQSKKTAHVFPPRSIRLPAPSISIPQPSPITRTSMSLSTPLPTDCCLFPARMASRDGIACSPASRT